MKARGGIYLIAAMLMACTKAPKWQTTEWQGEGPAPLPASLNSTGPKYKLNKGEVRFYQQQFAGVPVDGTFAKTFERKNGYDWASMRLVNESDLPTPEIILSALDNIADTIKQARTSLTSLPCAMAESSFKDMQPRLQWTGRHWELLFNLQCEDSKGRLWNLAFNNKGKLADMDQLGSNFSTVQVNATLYPAGPKLSSLKQLKLVLSSQPNYLSNTKITAVSDAGAKVVELSSVPGIKPGDIRFDLLQAYYYSSEILNWAQETFNFESQPLKIRTHVGYPDNTNASFYYQREVRLGAGDGKSFAQLSLDASIVDHETMHSVVDLLTGLPFQGEGGSLNEAMADSLAATFLNDARMGANAYLKGPYQRTLDNQLKYQNRTGGLYADSLVLSGLVWELHSKVSTDIAQHLIAHLLAFLTPASDFEATKKLVQSWKSSENLTQEQSVQVEEILRNRGWL